MTDQRDVTVVPRVVVDERRAVAHAGDLVAVVPPRHHARLVARVLTQPVVGLAEVVQNVSRPADDDNNKYRSPVFFNKHRSNTSTLLLHLLKVDILGLRTRRCRTRRARCWGK